MPSENFEFIEHCDILSYEDIVFAAEAFRDLGVEKIRVTGGEPLVRPKITTLLANLKSIDGIKEITLTTNGSLLGKYAEEIKNCGIRRINISIDSLKEERYSDITGGFDLNKLKDSLQVAINAGLNPIKTNTVLIRGFNDDEILDFCDFSAKLDIVCRFIEFMPVGNFGEWKKSQTIYGDEILSTIKSKYNAELISKEENAGPAKNYRLSNGGRIGIITPISNHFCADCDKLRLTADGRLRPCLLSDSEIDLRSIIRERDKSKLKQAIIDGLNLKEKEHSVLKENRDDGFKRTMSKIGG